MTYTEMIKNNVKTIEQYCKNTILPLIDGYIYVDLDETHFYGDGTKYKPRYSFYINKHTQEDIEIAFQIHNWTCRLDENHYDAIYKWLWRMEELLVRWLTIKTKLFNEINKQNEHKQ